VTTSTAAVARQPNSSLRVEQLEPDESRRDENRVRLVTSGLRHNDALVREGVLPTPLPAALAHELGGI